MYIPGYKTLRDRIIGRKIVYDLLIAITAIFGGLASALRSFGTVNGYDVNHFAGWLYVVGGILICAIAIAKFCVEWRNADNDESTHDLEGCLHTLHAFLMNSWGENGYPGLRLTLHVPAGKSHLQQVMEYVGDRRSVTCCAGRKFAAQSGVIGEALAQKTISTGSRTSDDYTEYINELVMSCFR